MYKNTQSSLKFVIYIAISILTTSCAIKLDNRNYNFENEVLYQTRALYFPKGKRTELLNQNYSGILAIANNDLLFKVTYASETAPSLYSLSIANTDIKAIKYVTSRKGKSILVYIDTPNKTYVFECFDTKNIKRELDEFLKEKDLIISF